MKEEVVKFQDKKVSFSIKTKKTNFLSEGIGLMFTKREKAKALLFNVKHSLALTSYFVFFPFIAIWLDKGKVVEIKKIKPFTLHIKPKKKFDQIIEIPINKRYKEIIEKLGF